MNADELPHDVKHHGVESDPYNWRLDAYRCYLLALRMKALQIGAVRPSTCFEMYWCEANGAIP